MNEFYFALPRLLARSRANQHMRSEKNSLEANVVGTLNHLLVYAFAFALLLKDLPGWQQVLLLLPLAVLVLIFWLLLLYVNSWIIKLLRAAGLMRALPNNRAQTLLISIVTTAMAGKLLFSEGWPRCVGLLWLAAVGLNLLAATLLAFRHGDRYADE